MDTKAEAAPTRGLLLGLCLVLGGSLAVCASLNYLLTPMLSDLGLTSEEGSIALAIPSVGSLLIVFVAARLGDQRGHRRVLTWLAGLFVVGSALVGVAEGMPALVVGLLLTGVAGTGMQIVVIGMLSQRFPQPRSRAAAFGTIGMVSPVIWLAFPVLTGLIVEGHSWRWVPMAWALAGALALIAARRLLPVDDRTAAAGDLWTPLLAGTVVAVGVQALSRANSSGLTDPITVLWIVVAVVAALSCAWRLRRVASPGFSLLPLRRPPARLLLLVVVLIPVFNTIFFMTIAFQYLYGLSVLGTALAMVPAQAAAAVGTRVIAAPLMRTRGTHRTAVLLLLFLIPSLLTGFAVNAESPLWVPILYVTLINVLLVSVSISITSAVMATVPTESGQMSAYRGSAQSLGAVLAVVVMNTVVFTLSRLGMTDEFQDQGLTQSQADSLLTQIQTSSTSPSVMGQYYSVPLPSGTQVSDVMSGAIATGIHLNALLGVLLTLGSIVLVRRAARAGAAASAAAD